MRISVNGSADDLRTAQVLHALRDVRTTKPRVSHAAWVLSMILDTLRSPALWLIAACILLLTL